MEGVSQQPDEMSPSLSDVTSHISRQVYDLLLPNPAQGSPRFTIPWFGSWGSGGCNDAFSGFGFLAFLLALLDLILELQGDMRRRRRDLRQEVKDPADEATAAVYAMYRGFLNSQAADQPGCAERFMCEAAQESAAQGDIGALIAAVASENAANWLRKENATKYIGIEKAAEWGRSGGVCGYKFSNCFHLPSIYKYPKVYEDYQSRYHNYY